MSASLDWRRIEAALEFLFRKEHFHLDTNALSEKIARTHSHGTINLTLLAQDLEKELNR